MLSRWWDGKKSERTKVQLLTFHVGDLTLNSNYSTCTHLGIGSQATAGCAGRAGYQDRGEPAAGRESNRIRDVFEYKERKKGAGREGRESRHTHQNSETTVGQCLPQIGGH